ncbi:MAG: acyl-homoserine-lactone synthase [Pseudomonadota bacterium]
MLRLLHDRAGQTDSALLEAAFEMRARTMSDQMGWRFEGQNTSRDTDEFDTDDTLHFISADTSGRVVAYGRLNPTMAPHMFSEVFADYCDLDGVLRSPRVYEHSRYLVDKSFTDKDMWRRHRGAVEVGIALLCVEAGVRAITWLSSMAAYTHVAKITQGTRPLGLPVYSDTDDCDHIAAVSDSVPEAIPFMAAYYGFDGAMMARLQRQVEAVAPSVAKSIVEFERGIAA